ncbi:hypothetical protein pipiens_019349, partial [Culex pipiens pipiens]
MTGRVLLQCVFFS